MNIKCMKEGKKMRCLLMGLAMFVVIIGVMAIFHKSTVFQWDSLTWVAIISIVICASLCNVCGDKKDKDKK